MAKPTPGPWKKIHANEIIYILGADEKVYVATIETGDRRLAYEAPGESAEANASMIEAAPQMLEELEAVRRELIGLSAYLSSCETHVIVQNLESLVASLQRRNSFVDAVIRQATGEAA